MDRRQYFEELIKDPHEIEFQRSNIKDSDIPILIAMYWDFEDWYDRENIIFCFIDREELDENGKKVMLDFLCAPNECLCDYVANKSIAIGFIDEKYQQFNRYYSNTKFFDIDLEECLSKHNLTLKKAPQKQSQKESPYTGDADMRLLQAAVNGNMEECIRAVEDGANINSYFPDKHNINTPPLVVSLMNQNFDIAEYLIEKKCNVNQTRDGGQSALHWACFYNNLEIIKMLHAKGADLDQADQYGSTAIFKAASAGDLDIVKYLAENGANTQIPIYDGRNAFRSAVYHGHVDVVKYFVERNYPFDEVKSNGETPLMVACQYSSLKMVKTLVEAGANIHQITNNLSQTPLLNAVRQGNLPIVKYLIKRGADYRYRSIDGKRLIDFVRGKKGQKVAEYLQEVSAKM